MKFSTSAAFSLVSRTWRNSRLLVLCALAAASSCVGFAPSASAFGAAQVDLRPDLSSTGFAVLNFDFGTDGWAPDADVLTVDPNGALVPVMDFSPQLSAILASQRHTNALLVQLVFLSVCFAVFAVSMATFKGLNHFLGYHGAAKKS